MYKQRGVFTIGMKRRSEAGRRGLPSRSAEVNSCVYQQVSNRSVLTPFGHWNLGRLVRVVADLPRGRGSPSMSMSAAY